MVLAAYGSVIPHRQGGTPNWKEIMTEEEETVEKEAPNGAGDENGVSSDGLNGHANGAAVVVEHRVRFK